MDDRHFRHSFLSYFAASACSRVIPNAGEWLEALSPPDLLTERTVREMLIRDMLIRVPYAMCLLLYLSLPILVLLVEPCEAR